MSRLVVDTDVVSFLFKNHPIAKLYDSELLGHTLMLSFMTVAGSFSGSGATFINSGTVTGGVGYGIARMESRLRVE